MFCFFERCTYCLIHMQHFLYTRKFFVYDSRVTVKAHELFAVMHVVMFSETLFEKLFNCQILCISLLTLEISLLTEYRIKE